MQLGGDALGGSGRFVAQTGSDTGLVVVAVIQGVPCDIRKAFLPFGQVCLQIHQIHLFGRPLAVGIMVQTGVLKLENHVQLCALGIGIFFCLFQSDAGAFANGHDVILGKNTPVHFLQVFVDTGPVAGAVGNHAVGIQVAVQGQIGHTVGLGDHGDNIHAEAVDTLVAPPGHHVENLIPDFGIFPVQIRLLLGEAVQIVHLGGFVPLPCGAGENTAPVVGLLAVLGFPPDVVVALVVIPGAAAFQEPLMFVRGVVDHQVHHDLDSPVVGGGEQFVKVSHGAEFHHDVLIIGNVVAVVIVGRPVNGAHPDHIDAQLLQIIQLADDALQIADTVTVAVAERAGIHLVNDTFLPPSLVHSMFPPKS